MDENETKRRNDEGRGVMGREWGRLLAAGEGEFCRLRTNDDNR